MRPAELNQLKAAMTMPSVDERAAYARYHEHRKHIASFCGTGNNVQFLPVSMALQIVGANITQKLSTILLGRAFVDMGFEKRCARHVRGYIVVRRSADEMRALRHQMAQKGTDGTEGTDVF